MKCYCNYEITDGDWRFCMNCGASTARLRLPNKDELQPQEISPTHSSQGTVVPLPLYNDGLQALPVEITIGNAPDWVQWAEAATAAGNSKKIRLNIPPGAKREVQLQTAPPDNVSNDSGGIPISLLVESWDAPRISPWRRDASRKQPINVRLMVRPQANLLLEEEILIFSSERQTRELTLSNPGAAPLEIQEFHADGFDVLVREDDTEEPLQDLLGQWKVPAQLEGQPGQSTLVIKIPTGRFKQVAEQAQRRPLELVLIDGAKREYRLRLHVLEDVGTRLIAPYIISIDFGTENTSVYARNPDPELDPNDPANVEPIPLFPVEGHESKSYRVPSYIAYRKTSSVEPPVIGFEAKQYYSDPNFWDHWEVHRDVKLWLRSEDPEKEAQNKRLLRDLLTVLRSEINAFLKRKLDADSVPFGVKYVVLLPVLDKGERYERQKQRMREVLLEVYGTEIAEGSLTTEDFIFVQESQAAVACFLLGNVKGLPIQGYRRGDLIAVVDSGAGTTDIALVQVTDASDVNKFDILGMLGTAMGTDSAPVSNELHEFCGRMVDRSVLNLMCHSAAEQATGGPPTPEDVKDMLNHVLNGTTLNDEARVMSWVEDAKKDLDSEEQVTLEDYVPITLDVEDYTARQIDLRQKLLPVLTEIATNLQSLLTRDDVVKRLEQMPPEQRRIRYLFAVGGNASMPVLEDQLRRYFDQSVVPLRDEKFRKLRMEAVVRGGAWSYHAPIGNLMPCDISWRMPTINEQVLLHENSAILEWRPAPRTIFVAAGDVPCPIETYAHLGEHSYRLQRIVIAEPGKYDIDFELSTTDWKFSVSVCRAGQVVDTRSYHLK